jgi:TonB family protein
MAPAKNRPVFKEALLPEGKQRWGSFSAGLGLECFALVLVIVLPLLIPQKFEAAQHYWVTPIEAPVIQPWKPQPPPPAPKPVVMKREIVKEIPKPEVVEVPKPKIYNPVITTPIVKQVVTKKVQAPDMTEVAKDFPNPSLGSSAIPTLKKPREQVQTGGFGDPNGVPTNGKTDRNVNIASAGSFDMPAGAGVGNGTGGAKGAKGVVASTGFGNGVAVGGNGGGSHGTVQQGMFDVKAADTPKVKQTAAVSNTKPVEILSKPNPIYTDEGRSKKIEGEVLVQVIFTAAGEVKVERVVRGLGYGLDESAMAAARQIRFKPAMQDGQPVDFPAIAHITFELAY